MAKKKRSPKKPALTREQSAARGTLINYIRRRGHEVPNDASNEILLSYMDLMGHSAPITSNTMKQVVTLARRIWHDGH